MNRNIVPTPIRHRSDNIPAFLRSSTQWIHWAATEEKNDGRFNKVPVSRTGFNINAHDPINWMTFEEAAQSFNPAVHSGIAIDLAGSKVKAADTLEEVFLIRGGVYKLVRLGLFPGPTKITKRSSRWPDDRVFDWAKAREQS